MYCNCMCMVYQCNSIVQYYEIKYIFHQIPQAGVPYCLLSRYYSRLRRPFKNYNCWKCFLEILRRNPHGYTIYEHKIYTVMYLILCIKANIKWLRFWRWKLLEIDKIAAILKLMIHILLKCITLIINGKDHHCIMVSIRISFLNIDILVILFTRS